MSAVIKSFVKTRLNFHCRWSVMLAAWLYLNPASATADLALLPVGKPVSARVMQLAAPAKLAKLSERIQAALASRPEWTKAYVAKFATVGGTLPYHENLGVSETEYHEMLSLSKQFTLTQTGTVELSATRRPDNSIHLRTTPPMRGIDGIVIDGDGRAVSAGTARLTDVKAINNTDPNSATGPWRGTQWRHEAMSANRIHGVKLAIGKRPEQGDIIVYLDVKDIGNGKNEVFDEILLFQPEQ